MDKGDMSEIPPSNGGDITIEKITQEFVRSLTEGALRGTEASNGVSNSTSTSTGNLTLRGLEDMLACFEAQFPRKTTPNSFRMCQQTWDYLKLCIPLGSLPSHLPLHLMPFSGFQGMPVTVKDDMEYMVVEVLNLDGEVIRTITL